MLRKTNIFLAIIKYTCIYLYVCKNFFFSYPSFLSLQFLCTTSICVYLRISLFTSFCSRNTVHGHNIFISSFSFSYSLAVVKKMRFVIRTRQGRECSLIAWNLMHKFKIGKCGDKFLSSGIVERLE